MEFFESAVLAIIVAATPLIYAAIGELVVERSGVLNLGVEGMMLIGAIAGFATAVTAQSTLLALLAAAVCGAIVSSLFAILVLVFLANQVATGLALTLFGVGLSALLGSHYVGVPLAPLPAIQIPVVSDIPVLGAALFRHDAMVYLLIALTVGVWAFFKFTRAGMIVRAVGESHDAAHALGHRVILIRFGAIMFGGAMAGLGGAYLSMVSTPMWVEDMTAGRGWIALALVVFGTWRPFRVAAGGLLFGALTILQLHAQGLGINVSSQLVSMLPYAATILVLVMISRDATRVRLNAPASLGQKFHPSLSRH